MSVIFLCLGCKTKNKYFLLIPYLTSLLVIKMIAYIKLIFKVITIKFLQVFNNYCGSLFNSQFYNILEQFTNKDIGS